MKKLLCILTVLAAVLSSCNDYETYGDKKEKERNAIAKFISDSSIVVITEDQFKQQGMTTDVSKNEFVKFDKNGVYMQIVRSGCGTELGTTESTSLVCRYREYNILNDTTQTWNDTPNFAASPDVMKITRNNATFTASFTSGVMYTFYGGSVPAGWLVPLTYVKVGRPQSFDENCAKVRLIVPHSQGHATASSNVMPFYYVITFQRQM
ncbi:MAG: DUF4827 domain-containing protein [Prevotella sp.]|nr:DUF4827 domain-containing protein [Prevotella sp.]